MALSDLAVFNDQLYKTTTEIMDQQIEAFNAASGGTLILTSGSNQGDFSEKALFKNMGGIVRRRDPYQDGAVSQKSLAHIKDISVKVASGTPEIRLDQAMWDWIKVKPAVAAAAMAQQLAADQLADYVNTAIGVGVTAIGQSSDTTYDTTTAGTTVTLESMISTTSLFGDRSGAIRSWVMHSGAMTALQLEVVKNAERLFTFGNINIMQDGFGRLFLVTDSPNLKWTSTEGKLFFNTLGLTEQAVVVEQNGDFHSNLGETNGYENIRTSFQAEWSANFGVKGYAWSGSHAPADAALMSASNWKRYVTSHKDTAGVILKSA